MDDHSRAAECRETFGAADAGGPGGAACAATGGGGAGCPYVERDDVRCGHRFTLGRIDQAFTVCFGAFHGCPIYQGMIGQSEARPAAGAANSNVIPLRATGT